MESGYSPAQAGRHVGDQATPYDAGPDRGAQVDGGFLMKGFGRRIRRRAYTRKNGTRVPARLIRDVGAPGKWSYENMGAPGIGKLGKGSLTSLGYSSSAPTKTRRRAVDRAIKTYGKLSTLRKLNAVAIYTRRTSPAKSRVFKSDVRYVQKK
jgi:hypothetical protein